MQWCVRSEDDALVAGCGGLSRACLRACWGVGKGAVETSHLPVLCACVPTGCRVAVSMLEEKIEELPNSGDFDEEVGSAEHYERAAQGVLPHT